MIQILKAEVQDAIILTEIAKKTFLDDNKLKPQNADMSGPPGHDKISVQERCIKYSIYYKALFDQKIIGGGFFWKKLDRVFYIDGMFVDPAYQNRGIGSQIIEYMLINHKPLEKWTLGTPSFSKRNHYFYEKYGFIKVKEIDNGNGWLDYLYEKYI